MSTKPCESNDNFALLDLSDALSVSTRLSSKKSVGSGCNNAQSTAQVQDPDREEFSMTNPSYTSTVTFLSCKTTDDLELTNSYDIERIELSFAYDFHVTNVADPSFSLSVFELDLLKAVANEFGLSSCAFGRRSLRNGQRKLNSTGALVGIGSNPSDVVDATRDCMENTDSTNESSSCIPMIGFMTAWVDKTAATGLVTSDIYTIIENYSKDYSTNEGVHSISYIGTRPDMVVSHAELAFLNERTAMAPGALIGISVASVLALLSVFALVVLKRRYKNMNVKVMGDDDDDDDDNEDKDVLEIVVDDDSEYSVTTECCTVDETIGSSVKKTPGNVAQGEDGPLGDEGFELSYDEVISKRDNSYP